MSAATLDVAIDRVRGPVWTGRFDNDATGHRRLIRVLKKKGPQARVVLEATGVYHLDLALALHGTAGIEVMVANPRATKDFARAQMQRSKTDRTDALSLLEFARRMDFEPWSPPPPEVLSLRALARHMEALVRMGAQEKNRDHAAAYGGEASDPVRDAIREHLDWIEGTVQELQQKALAVVASSPELQSAYDHLVSVKGIAAGSAIALLAELAVLPSDMTARQWVAVPVKYSELPAIVEIFEPHVQLRLRGTHRCRRSLWHLVAAGGERGTRIGGDSPRIASTSRETPLPRWHVACFEPRADRRKGANDMT